ncbi:MAG: amino acid adenylation domain-containing protein, partial [Ktedonobacteraceae bacterium]|nr:amino acid adenylation domain-containing protein [Ktedonobacteraceae bacterium]
MLTHEEFAYQAQQTPDAVAVVYEDMQLTYREIDRRSNRVMHYLKMKQVGPEIHVGICVERSPELIIGLLGIFKAGGAYIPIDPLYPRERSSFLIEDAQISVIVTQKSLFETFATYPVQTIGVDMLEISASQEISQQILFKSVLSQNLAYIIYTSGSTGRPKGVQIDHGSLAALIDAQTQLYTIQPGERVLQFASISFDASVYEIFSTLANGATLVLAKQNELLPGPALVKLLREQVITIATLPPSVLAVLPDEELPALKTITSAGEACSAQIVSRWSPGRTFFNAYGPTEATVCATAAQCTDGTCQPPIGKAIAHKEVYVLDPDLHPVAPGESGEIYIGGEGLARGYLHQPNITAERFVPHPFTDQPGSRLYRTGDLARLLLDGSLEFLGRLDYQVKIRGFRIEPGEVEVALERHPLITQAVVLAQESPSVGVRLVAYTVINQQPGPGVDELRSFIRTWVPEYMVPALFVPMNAFPLTPNGKVDRQALPEPDQARPDLDEAFVAPRNVDEQYLADIWASVLGLESIGIHDNFFALGGHSLSAMQIIARVREIFHVDLPFSTLFATPTVVETMMAIHALQSVAQPLTVCPIQPAPRDGYLPLAFAQEQVWLIHQLAPDNRAYMASSHIKIEGDFDMSLLKRSIDELVVRHEILRTAFPTVDQLPVQIIHEPQPQDLNVIDLEPFPEPEREAEIQRLIREASSAPFDIERLPLMRWTLLKLSAQDHILILVEHHFVHDGWSSNMLLAELSEIYTALLEGRPVSLPALPIQFADFAYWQHQWIESAEAAKQRTYWVHKLASGSELLRLPIDRPRPALPDFQGSTIRIHLSAQRYEALTALSRQQGVTPFMTLFAAFLTLLYRYTGQEDLCVGSSMANRRWHEMERVAGMVVNTIVLRGNVSATT